MDKREKIFKILRGNLLYIVLFHILLFPTKLTIWKRHGDLFQLKKYFRSLLFICIFTVFSLQLMSQATSDKVFALNHKADTTLIIKQQFNNDALIQPFGAGLSAIYGLTFTGDINLNSGASLVRIILVDNQYNEYLVYEAYQLLEENSKFTVNGTGEETVTLNGVKPLMLKLEITDASVKISKLEISTKSLKSTSSNPQQIHRMQTLEKIDEINRNIQKKGLTWKAGETSISKMTYGEKKRYFGGKIPNLQGFEYYVGGIFVVSGTNTKQSSSGNTGTNQSAASDSPAYTADFSWANRHGQNWMTSVKNQGGCGSCWAFAAAGATELLVNLYYNRHLNLDLSEQNLISGTNGSCADGGFVDEALNYIKNTGVVNESCFPYKGEDVPLTGMCSEPNERIKIGGYSGMIARSVNDLKQAVVKGPVALVIESWSHAVALAGFKIIKKDDIVDMRNSSKDSWRYISPDDSLIGQTAWLIKNSWGTNWGENGYAYIVTPISDLKWSEAVFGPVSSLNLSDTSIVCTDNDGDGYYTWGIGPKPSYCPPCPDEPDGDDSDPCLGPMDAYGNILPVSPPPAANSIIVDEGEEVPDLVASGENLKWYGDAALTNLLDTGNVFASGQTEGCLHSYYVTQTVNGCISSPAIVELSILQNVSPPSTSDIGVCEGILVPNLFAEGENIHWYDDEQLSHLIYIGDSLPISYTQPGTYKYYATQSLNNCESEPQSVNLTINPLPKVDIGKDTTVIPGQILRLKVDNVYSSYKWSNGSDLSYTELSAGSLKSDYQLLTLEVTDNNGCENIDSIKIFLQSPAYIRNYDEKIPVVIYPNPNRGTFNISYNSQNSNNLLVITLINSEGRICYVQKGLITGAENIIRMDVPGLTSGIYLVKINLGDSVYTERMVVN